MRVRGRDSRVARGTGRTSFNWRTSFQASGSSSCRLVETSSSATLNLYQLQLSLTIDLKMKRGILKVEQIAAMR